MYSPFVPFMLKKHSVGPFDLAEETPLHKRKAVEALTPRTQKKVCLSEASAEESQASSTANDTDQDISGHYPEGELERLIHSIG